MHDSTSPANGRLELTKRYSLNPYDPSLLVQYEMTFPKRQRLLGPATSSAMGGNATDEPRDSMSGVTEQLVDDIKWEPNVDGADKLDYILAVSSGVITGLVDVFFVGKLSLENAHEWGKGQIEQVVMMIAQMEGYGGDNLKEAIAKLEKRYPFAADGNTNDFGGGLQHHFRDFSHHFSVGGLVCSIFTQFTGKAIGTNNYGGLIVKSIPESHRQYLGKNLEEKLAFGIIDWFFHMVSDMAGSSAALNGGTGIPGPLVSFMKELSALPFFKDSQQQGDGFRHWLSKLFNGTLLAQRDGGGRIVKKMQFDLRTEVGIVHETGKQIVPVLINQCVVRSFYFVRAMCRELRELDIKNLTDLDKIAPEDVLPFGTPTVRRMITVSSGVLVGVDFADAAVRAVLVNKPVTFFLHINYVGVATFVVACTVDIHGHIANKRAEESENPEDAFERSISDLGCLKLDLDQARILHSLEQAMIGHDIEREEKPKRKERKRIWFNEWSERIVEAVGSVHAVDAGYFMDEDALHQAIESMLGNESGDSWLWLIIVEAICFKPYIPLHGKKTKSRKSLKFGNDYLVEVFCKRQPVVCENDIADLENALGKAGDMLDGVVQKRVIGAVGTVAVVAATGGLAFYFAPAIAPVLAAALGAQTASLSGAALTSASLAFLGGGALAAGGAGMAGGTMLIAGGGAMLAAVGSAGVSSATVMTLVTDGSYVLEECAKLVTFSKEVLIKRYKNVAAVVEIQANLNRRIVELQIEVEAFKRELSTDEASQDALDQDVADDQSDISPKKAIKVLNRSLTFLKRSNDELSKMLKEASK